MTQKLGLCITLLALAAPLVQCISVIGPRVLRPFNSYKVAIGGSSRPYNLYVAVEGRRANGEQYSQGQEIQVPVATSRLIDIDIGDPGPGQYALVARSTSGPLFSSSASLLYQPRSFCIFVQTDKRVYQPGDTINFRVIALDKYLLPLSTTVDVSMLDTGGSPIRQWVNSKLDRGVLTKELDLADEPALGEWTIQVEARGQKYSQHIVVADYVLPRFHMEMHLPKEVLFSEGRFDVNVTAKHFNGRPVRGELTISAYPVYFSGLLQPVVAAPTRKVLDINGQTEVTFDLKTDLDLAEDAARPLVVEAVLEEKDTLIKQNVSSRILLLRAPYRLRVSAPNFFKPALPYIVQIEVVNPAGLLIPTSEEVTVERLWDDGAPVNITKITLNKGVASYTTVPDKRHVNSTLNLLIKYKEVTERVVHVQRNEYTSQFLTAEVLTRNTSVGGEMRARITATEPMDMVHYAVIGRGDIIVGNTVELSPARKSVDVTVSVTSHMAPGCTFLAWYPTRDAPGNKILSAAVYAPQKGLLQNQVIISPVSTNGASPKPNTLVELRVLGESGALVGLLSEDTNAINAGLAQMDGLGHGLDVHRIERETERFNTLPHSVFKNEEHLSMSGLDLGGFTASDVFKNAGVVILTDGVVVQNNPDGSIPTQAPIETGTRAPLAGPYAFSRLPPPLSPRYYLTITPQNTWMLANLTIGNDGNGAKERWTAETPGVFSIGAFSVHPTLGLGLATPQKFETSVPLALTAELPASLQRGETVAAVVILKTTLAVDTSVEVTFYNSDQYFDFEPLDNELDSAKKIELFRRVRVTVPARGSISTAFLVTAVRTGEVPVIVEASGQGVSASLFRTIDVKDGYEGDLWAWSLLDARKTVARANVTLKVRPGVKPGAISLRATGDMLAAALEATKSPPGPSADAIHALRPLSFACVLLDYLQATSQAESATTKEARELAAKGYQRLMAFRRPDGSFATEHDPEAEGDVWMTAAATRWLSRCSRYVSAEATPAAAAAAWLAHAQIPDGSWPAPAPSALTDPHAQAPLPLTAYALIALHHSKGSDGVYKNNINKALDFVARGVSQSLDAYTLAVIGGALAATRHPQLTQTLELMDKYANTTGSTLFWSRTLYKNEWRNPWLDGNSLEATTAAWGLRAMLAARLLDEATPVTRYLLQAFQPNDPDPEVLDSIAQYAEMIQTSTKLRLSVKATGSEEVRQFQIAENNALIIQTQSVRNSRSVSAVTEGRGIALVGLSAKGSTNVTAPWPRYTLDPRVDQVSTKDRLQLSVCFGFVSQGNETESGLALLIVQLPSGYLADITTLNELTALRHVVWARVARGGARVVAGVRAGSSERCATLAAPRALPVARQRPAWATLLDLYDSSHRARVFYQTHAATACDVCREWESCSRACGSPALQVSGDGRPKDDRTGQTTTTGQYPSAASIVAPTIILALITSLFMLLY